MSDGRSPDIAKYEADVQRLRANGCTCPLRWSGAKAIPATGCNRSADRLICDVDDPDEVPACGQG